MKWTRLPTVRFSIPIARLVKFGHGENGGSVQGVWVRVLAETPVRAS